MKTSENCVSKSPVLDRQEEQFWLQNCLPLPLSCPLYACSCFSVSTVQLCADMVGSLIVAEHAAEKRFCNSVVMCITIKRDVLDNSVCGFSFLFFVISGLSVMYQ